MSRVDLIAGPFGSGLFVTIAAIAGTAPSVFYRRIATMDVIQFSVRQNAWLGFLSNLFFLFHFA
jgi:hypothetical protein